MRTFRRSACQPAVLSIVVLCCGPALAAGQPAPYCARTGTDDALRTLPPSLVAAARGAFGLRATPAGLIERGTVWRCAQGRVLACFVGANLPCGKLEARENLAAVDTWCRSHPGGPVPASVSGHETLWRWRCDGAAAQRDGQAWHLDARGFAAELWKPLRMGKPAVLQ